SFWENLPKISLTAGALRELDRRSGPPQLAQRSDFPSLDPRFHTNTIKHYRPTEFAPDIIKACSPNDLKEIKKLARRGGPDISSFQYFLPPPQAFDDISMEPAKFNSHGTGPSSESMERPGRKATTTYSRNFEQHLISHNIYPVGYMYPDDRIPADPRNLDAINAVLSKQRNSPPPSDEDFGKFRRACPHASKEDLVTTLLIPKIEGNTSNPRNMGAGYPFRNLAPLTNGGISHAKPDLFHGARPGELNDAVCQELNNQVAPSTEIHLPLAPNFFLEVKGNHGSSSVADRQACYDGALGARAIHALRTFRQDQDQESDGNAYTITATFHDGTLKLFTTHRTEPRNASERPEYIMTLVGGWFMPGNFASFRQGVAAYRNARDWAKGQRDEIISRANE
ncbi:hypothetical protein BO70DRAFT_256472, partial [Aspergillus heteromorphus CBS 117.55]